MRFLTVLHPRHKLQYFRDAGWQEDWIVTAETLLRNRFRTGYCTDGLSNETGVVIDEVCTTRFQFRCSKD